MNKGIRGLFFIASATLLVACAGPNLKAPTPAARPVQAKGDADISAGKTVPTSGYRKVTKNGVDYFCSRETLTGSRTDTQVRCLTAEQLAAIREGAQDMLRRQQSHVGQVDPSANPGGAPYSAAQPLP
jgi:hypothetical protein